VHGPAGGVVAPSQHERALDPLDLERGVVQLGPHVRSGRPVEEDEVLLELRGRGRGTSPCAADHLRRPSRRGRPGRHWFTKTIRRFARERAREERSRTRCFPGSRAMRTSKSSVGPPARRSRIGSRRKRPAVAPRLSAQMSRR